jgi:hypothetical protein
VDYFGQRTAKEYGKHKISVKKQKIQEGRSGGREYSREESRKEESCIRDI